MSQLSYIQNQFWDALRSENMSSSFPQLLTSGGRLTQNERLTIYRKTIRAAHIETLCNIFKCCKNILGDRYFKKIANDFFVKYPSNNQNLNLYGESFPEYLEISVKNLNELSEYKYLPDLAQLELALEQCYFAKDDINFDFTSLQKLDSDEYKNICFELSPSLSLIKSNYPIHEVWLANTNSDSSHEIQSIQEPQYLCVTRKNYKPETHKINQNDWQVMSYIMSNLSLIEIETSEKNSNIDLNIEATIPELIQKKWICGYKLKGCEF